MRLPIFITLVVLVGAPGCQTARLGGLNPFYRPEQTSYLTASKRIAEIRRTADLADGQDTTEQRRLVAELITTLTDEADPLVRETVLVAAAKFNTPLAQQALQAGVRDADPHVRQTCCRLLGERPGEESTQALLAVVQGDDSFDVRIAAARALGTAGASTNQLLPVLEDPNPAMQLVGVEAMRRTTGRDLGGDVAAYRALARGETLPPGQEETRVATRLPSWLPFF